MDDGVVQLGNQALLVISIPEGPGVGFQETFEAFESDSERFEGV